MLTSVSNHWLTPGISDTYQTLSKDILWGRMELAVYTPGLISGAIRDSGNTLTTLIRPGMLLGQITATKKLIAWTPTAVDGSENLFGILPMDLNAQILAANADTWVPVLVRGCVKAASLIIGGNASYGIASDTYEWAARNQLSKNFMLDDKMQLPGGSRYRKIVSVTADTTVTSADHGTLFVTAGSGAINFTLPVMTHGFEVGFYNAVDQNITLTSNPADTLVVYNDIAADSVALSTSSEKIGGSFDVFGLSSGKALVKPCLWEGQTMTIVS